MICGVQEVRGQGGIRRSKRSGGRLLLPAMRTALSRCRVAWVHQVQCANVNLASKREKALSISPVASTLGNPVHVPVRPELR